MAPDQITIDGVTISRELWEQIEFVLRREKPTPDKWEAFVAANTKPEHVKGETCTAPVWDIFESEAKEIDHFLFNELSDKLTYGEWYLTRDGTIGLAESNHTALRWTLTAVPRKPAPRYDVGKWVVPPNGEPFKVVRYDRRYYWANKEDGWIESSLRPAVREDFMVTFGGVKVWMIRKNGVVEEFRERSDGFISWEQLLPWQVERNCAAGILPMPEEFWK